MSSRQQSTAWRVDSELSSAGRPTVNRAAEAPAETFDTTDACVECGARSFTRSDAGEWFCDKCGVVHTRTELEFTEPGWTPRAERRTGPAASASRLGVGTRIGDGAESGDDTPFWARYNDRLTYDNRTLFHGLRELRALANALEATELITERAAHHFRRATAEGLLVGHSLEAMAAACVHVTAREADAPFPLKQVANASPVDLAAIKSAVSKLLREFDLRVAPPLPTAFVARFASDAGLGTDVERHARAVLEVAMDDEVHVGQSPTGVAAAALYGAASAAEVNVTQSELASVAYVSVVTLSRQWQTIEPYLDDTR